MHERREEIVPRDGTSGPLVEGCGYLGELFHSEMGRDGVIDTRSGECDADTEKHKSLRTIPPKSAAGVTVRKLVVGNERHYAGDFESSGIVRDTDIVRPFYADIEWLGDRFRFGRDPNSFGSGPGEAGFGKADEMTHRCWQKECYFEVVRTAEPFTGVASAVGLVFGDEGESRKRGGAVTAPPGDDIHGRRNLLHDLEIEGEAGTANFTSKIADDTIAVWVGRVACFHTVSFSWRGLRMW